MRRLRSSGSIDGATVRLTRRRAEPSPRIERRVSEAGNRLPARYDLEWGTEFRSFVDRALVPTATILDVGSGRTPTIPVSERPPAMRYVGLDVSPHELKAAPAGSYDEVVFGDAEIAVPELRNRFDLIVSWNVLEHVRHLDRAASVLHNYARPGGWLVASLSGRNAVFAIANRVLPSAVAARAVAHLRERPLESVFRAHYDHCTDRGLRGAFALWEELEVVPLWHAADYFDRVPRVQRLYLVYENWIARHRIARLATHYVVAARKASH
jgi:SAM-dependent methyltransferase